MTTKFVGVKEFRQNIAKFAKSSKKNKQRLVILNRNVPIFEVRPISEKDFTLEKLSSKIERGLKDVKAGRVYTQAQVMKSLGL
ncbi:MAG TPA: hypothetical protein VHQ41_01470 [Patescibacteria group bacterium]|jgi:PHD/YefM family antitoxin component YafN of YafNO toxin-antitoxin module|nr:hypothetical protein [Patescibacteria group bacterium]